MTNKKWIGGALGLALCSTALASCSYSDKGSSQSNAEASGPAMNWTRETQKQLVEAISRAPANGLKPDLFLKGDLPKDDNERFAVLTNAALKYAQALAHGIADPKTLAKDYTIPRPGADVRAGLEQAIKAGNVGQWLNSLPPQTSEYQELSKAHLAYLAMANAKPFQPIPAGKPLKPGASDPRVPLVIAALSSIQYLPSNAAGGTSYGGPLATAVKRLQADIGIKADGIIGDTTRDALNLGPGGRARQLAIAMERLRWLDREPAATRIDVNTAAAFLDYWRGGTHVDRRNVVPGEPDKPTPQIQASFGQLVANPYWRIPDSIYKEELAAKGSGYFAANNMTFQDGRLVQLPGPKNSLGQVKFDVQDPQQIYLHDTPAKALFALPERHRSHGCVRVQNALQFAALIADQDQRLPQFERALASGEETYVKLATQIPVRLLYHTAFFDGGKIQFRPDVYGWDDDVAMALGLVRGAPRKAYQSQGGDIGP